MFILADIGGTHMRIACSADGKTISEPSIVATPQNPHEALSEFTETAKRISGGTITKVVAGIPGPFDETHSTLLAAPNLPQWEGLEIRVLLEEKIGAPVVLDNDTALVGLGEARHGAGRGSKVVAYLTFSTGVGGVRIADGEIVFRTHDFEPGHQIIDIDALLYESANEHTLHDYASGAAIEKRFDCEPSQLHNDMFWRSWERVVSVAIHNTTLYWGPDIVVLGGSVVTKNPHISIERIARRAGELMHIYPKAPEVVMATLEDKGGLYGALIRANEK